MSRPSGGYTISGEPVPGVTTIISRFKDSGGLLKWAHTCGLKGLNMTDIRDKAAGSGGKVHDAIEAYILEKEPPEELSNNEKNALESWIWWWKMRGSHRPMEVVECEIPHVCLMMRFGGTPDAVLRQDGQLYIADWKTGKGVYADVVVQLGAYYELLCAAHVLDRYEIEDAVGLVVHVPLDGSPAREYKISNSKLRAGREAFCTMRELYDQVSEVEDIWKNLK